MPAVVYQYGAGQFWYPSPILLLVLLRGVSYKTCWCLRRTPRAVLKESGAEGEQKHEATIKTLQGMWDHSVLTNPVRVEDDRVMVGAVQLSTLVQNDGLVTEVAGWGLESYEVPRPAKPLSILTSEFFSPCHAVHLSLRERPWSGDQRTGNTNVHGLDVHRNVAE